MLCLAVRRAVRAGPELRRPAGCDLGLGHLLLLHPHGRSEVRWLWQSTPLPPMRSGLLLMPPGSGMGCCCCSRRVLVLHPGPRWPPACAWGDLAWAGPRHAPDVVTAAGSLLAARVPCAAGCHRCERTWQGAAAPPLTQRPFTAPACLAPCVPSTLPSLPVCAAWARSVAPTPPPAPSTSGPPSWLATVGPPWPAGSPGERPGCLPTCWESGVWWASGVRGASSSGGCPGSGGRPGRIQGPVHALPASAPRWPKY